MSERGGTGGERSCASRLSRWAEPVAISIYCLTAYFVVRYRESLWQSVAAAVLTAVFLRYALRLFRRRCPREESEDARSRRS